MLLGRRFSLFCAVGIGLVLAACGDDEESTGTVSFEITPQTGNTTAFQSGLLEARCKLNEAKQEAVEVHAETHEPIDPKDDSNPPKMAKMAGGNRPTDGYTGLLIQVKRAEPAVEQPRIYAEVLNVTKGTPLLREDNAATSLLDFQDTPASLNGVGITFGPDAMNEYFVPLRADAKVGCTTNITTFSSSRVGGTIECKDVPRLRTYETKLFDPTKVDTVSVKVAFDCAL
jgi:hypothetical protein